MISTKQTIKAVERVEPLPCPCCGTENVSLSRGRGWQGYGVKCGNPACGLALMLNRSIGERPSMKSWAELGTEAVEAWNKRAEVQP